MKETKFQEYIEHRIREIERYIESCIYNLENATLPDVTYYDREIAKSEEVKQELKHILEICK